MEAIRPALDHLTPGATYIDVGANVGVYAMFALDRVGPTGEVHCFEIDERPLAALRKTIRSFRICNIVVHRCAVSNQDGETSFEPNVDHGHNRITADGRGGRTLPCVRLDTWVEAHGLQRVDVIKIDVEGAERFVLEGAHETLVRFKPLVLCEASDQNAAAFGYSATDLVQVFGALGYSAQWLKGVWTPTLLAAPSRP